MLRLLHWVALAISLGACQSVETNTVGISPTTFAESAIVRGRMQSAEFAFDHQIDEEGKVSTGGVYKVSIDVDQVMLGNCDVKRIVGYAHMSGGLPMPGMEIVLIARKDQNLNQELLTWRSVEKTACFSAAEVPDEFRFGFSDPFSRNLDSEKCVWVR